jgi:peptidoglycan/LPS O-acetylase OafA/YrhL
VTAHPSKRLTYLDTWRCLAVGLVILNHLRWNDSIHVAVDAQGYDGIFQFGFVGVSIFFFISGYVVSTTCLREVASSRTFSAPAFYVRRIFRIMPPLLLYLTTCLLLGSLGFLYFSFINFLSAATYLCNTTLTPCGWYAGHTWSLAYEEQFYLLFPFVFAFVELHRKPDRVLFVPCIMIALLPLVFVVDWLGRVGFFVTYALFSLGYLFAKHQDWIERVIAKGSLPLFLMCAALVFYPPDPYGNPDFEMRYRFVYVAAIPLLVLSTGVPGTLMNRLFENRPLAYVGRISYSIYLWQELILGPERAGIPGLLHVGMLLLMIAMCAVSFEVFEKRMIRIGRGYSDRLQGREQVPLPG